MSELDYAFWDAAIAASLDSAALRRKADHLVGYVIEFNVDGVSSIFEFHRGEVRRLDHPPLTGVKSRVSGPAAEWHRVTSGEIPFVRAINGLHGHLRWEGSALENTWASPAIGEFLSISAAASKD